jgi:hypothetical protein
MADRASIDVKITSRRDHPDWPAGTQVKYTPTHAAGDDSHPDIQYGFVTSVNEARWPSGQVSTVVFCRYFYNPEKMGEEFAGVLRTTANSEACDPSMLEVYQWAPHELITETMAAIDKDTMWQ